MVNKIEFKLQLFKESISTQKEKCIRDNFDEKKIITILQSAHCHLADTFLEYLNSKPKFRCISSLPKELHCEIFGYLDFLSLTNLARTNQFFHHLIHLDEKFKTRTIEHREVLPIKTAIKFLEEKIEELEKNGSKKVNEILKKMPFLLPYLAESNPKYALKLIQDLKKLPTASDAELTYFLLAGLANLKDQSYLMKALSENPEMQISELVQVTRIVSQINRGQILNLIEIIQEKQSLDTCKEDVTFYCIMYAEWLMLTSPQIGKKVLQAINIKPIDGLIEDSVNEEKDFEGWIKDVPEALIRDYKENSPQVFSDFNQFIRLFERMVKKSSVENVKKLVEMAAMNPIFLIDFLFGVDLSFFKTHLEFTSGILQSISNKPLLPNHKFMLKVFEIRYRSLKLVDSSHLSKYLETIIKLELLKNDLTQIDSFILKDMDEYDDGVLLIAFKIISKIDSDFAFKSVELCKLAEDKKIHIRSLLADILRRERLHFQKIDSSFYIDKTLSNIDRITCGYSG